MRSFNMPFRSITLPITSQIMRAPMRGPSQVVLPFAMRCVATDVFSTSTTKHSDMIINPNADAKNTYKDPVIQRIKTLYRAKLNALPAPAVQVPAVHAPCGYWVFLKENFRTTLRKLGRSASVVDVATELGRQWREMDSAQREPFEKTASINRAVHKLSLKTYLKVRTPEDLVIEKTRRRFKRKLGLPARAVPRDVKAPVRPLNSYFLFARDLDQRDSKIVELLGDKDLDTILAVRDVKIRQETAALLWKFIDLHDPNLKKHYIDRADEDMKIYNEDLKAYNKENSMEAAKQSVRTQIDRNLAGKKPQLSKRLRRVSRRVGRAETAQAIDHTVNPPAELRLA